MIEIGQIDKKLDKNQMGMDPLFFFFFFLTMVLATIFCFPRKYLFQ
jgi:hypothetical protein